MPFSCEFRVAWVDTDALGIVHFSNYFRYFERAEQEFYLGARQSQEEVMEKLSVSFPRVSAKCDYKSPLHSGDMIRVSLFLDSMGRSSITIRFTIVQKQTETLAAEGLVTIVCVDRDRWKPVEIPVEVRNIFMQLS